jgi:hypothetical protein
MSISWLTAYILVWPVIAAGVMAVLVVSLVKDWRAARRCGQTLGSARPGPRPGPAGALTARPRGTRAARAPSCRPRS